MHVTTLFLCSEYFSDITLFLPDFYFRYWHVYNKHSWPIYHTLECHWKVCVQYDTIVEVRQIKATAQNNGSNLIKELVHFKHSHTLKCCLVNKIITWVSSIVISVKSKSMVDIRYIAAVSYTCSLQHY